MFFFFFSKIWIIQLNTQGYYKIAYEYVAAFWLTV